MWMLATWSASVIGLSTETVSGTVLPFSTIGGISSLTLPRLIAASPVSPRIASSIAADVAKAGGASEARPTPAAASNITRRVGDALCNRTSITIPSLIAQGPKEGYHILDLLCGQDRPSQPCAADPREAVDAVVGRHD